MSENPQTSRVRSVKLLQCDITQVNKSQLNSSSSKMQYSMPRAPRFPHDKSQDETSKFYDIPDTKTTRSTSLGYGSKTDLAQSYFQKPSPSQYHIKGEFQQPSKKKGITISAGREVIKTNSAFVIVKDIPGPGQYNPKAQPAQSKGYTIQNKQKDLSNKWINLVPGPGNYETLELLDKNLRSSNSKIQNVRSSRFPHSKRKSQFDQMINQKVPGPGEYPKYDQLNLTAKFPNVSAHKFSNSQRQGIVQKSKISIPGPGAYKYFSEFLY